MTLERDVLRQVLDYLKLVHPDWLVWRQNQGIVPTSNGQYRRFVGLRGVSDILGVTSDGRILCCEVKRPGGKLSEHQEDFLGRVGELGGVALCVSSVEELQEDLKSLGL